MKVESLGRNKTLVRIDDPRKSIAILVSYSTPVAALVKNDGESWKAYRASKFYSVTTFKHIKQWLESWFDVAELKEESFFDNLLKVQ